MNIMNKVVKMTVLIAAIGCAFMANAAEARIGTTEYATLQKAVFAAKTGDRIIVTSDIRKDVFIWTSAEWFELDLNGHTIAGLEIFNKESDLFYVVHNGTIDCYDSCYGVAVNAYEGVSVALYDITVFGTLYANGEIFADSGYFYLDSTAYPLLCGNVYAYEGFFETDPADFIDPGYKTVQGEDGLWTIEIDETYTPLQGEGTEEDPFVISNLTEFRFFVNSVNNGETIYNAMGTVISLECDLDLADEENFAGIGSLEYPFCSTFNGNDYTISNITRQGGESEYGVGFINVLGSNSALGRIMNTRFSNVKINAGTWSEAAGIVGLSRMSSMISDITVEGDIEVTAFGCAGAIVGGGEFFLIDSVVDANAGSMIQVECYAAGGIAGMSEGWSVIDGCEVANLTVNGFYFLGGILGSAYDCDDVTNNTVTDCTVEHYEFDIENEEFEDDEERAAVEFLLSTVNMFDGVVGIDESFGNACIEDNIVINSVGDGIYQVNAPTANEEIRVSLVEVANEVTAFKNVDEDAFNAWVASAAANGEELTRSDIVNTPNSFDAFAFNLPCDTFAKAGAKVVVDNITPDASGNGFATVIFHIAAGSKEIAISQINATVTVKMGKSLNEMMQTAPVAVSEEQITITEDGKASLYLAPPAGECGFFSVSIN